ncbi:MFS transporter [Kocuria sp.]|uniref:MFS transporter n=1 Tax=Kocuria sp. TaxID=1871328 RepID=UPI0026DB9756|nr:MFS transporter [Kocuria sp.]MDO4917915.1 MFS transporter [Kocuria sp.]
MAHTVTPAGPDTRAHARAAHGAQRGTPREHNPWAALSALCIGFFMILVDSTIVSVATQTIVTSLNSTLNQVLWVTSAYLLAYAVPLLVTGRLGDRFGTKRVYLAGLAVFTLSSLWCGLSGTIGMLITARVVQGLGAALMTPQTMAVITRIFPADRRGQAMGAWGATAGIASLVGPILGGLLVDHGGWEWIFFVNVPVGVVGFIMAVRLVPDLPGHARGFDLLGVLLSAAGLFCLVFGIQEGEKYDWGTITGILSVPLLLVLGVVVLAVFVWWQKVNRHEPLVPLHLFANRNFTLANVAITAVGFAITAMSFPLMIYAQVVHGYTPTRAALLLVPMALISAVLAPVVGRLVDRHHPALIAGFGLLCFGAGLAWYGLRLDADTSVLELLCIAALLGVGNGFMWSPLSVSATRTLEPRYAGAGAGIFNTTRQFGSVLGSAAVASLMDSRLSHHLGAMAAAASEQAPSGHAMPPEVAHSFARAMGETFYLPAAVVAVGVVAVLFFSNPHRRPGRHVAAR